MKELLMITYDRYPHEGGKSTHMSYLISGLNSIGVKTSVVSFDTVNNAMYAFMKLLIQPTKIKGLDCYLYYRLKAGKYLFKKQIKKALKNDEYDMISAQDAISCSLLNGLETRNAKISLTMHTYFGLEYTLDNDALNEENPYYQKLLKEELESLNIVNGIIAVDSRIKEHLMNIISTHSRKDSISIHSIKNFINTDVFKKKNSIDESIDIICVRRLVEKNGVIYAVKAMKGLDKCIKLHIVGDGPERGKIETFIRENNLQSQVILYGSVKNEDILEFYHKCNVAIVPSITVNGLQEATSISALEAMASGMPVIVSSIGGLAELISDKQNGLWANEKDESSIRECILWINNNPRKSEEIGERARNYIVDNHSHIVAASKYLEIFESNK